MPKAKVSVTIESSLLLQVERMARGASRSEVVESALASWLRNRRREKLEEETELYYRSLGAAEGEENAEWAELSQPLHLGRFLVADHDARIAPRPEWS